MYVWCIPLLAKGSWVPILKTVPDPQWFYSGVFSPLPYLYMYMYTDAELKVSSMCYILYIYVQWFYALYTMLLQHSCVFSLILPPPLPPGLHYLVPLYHLPPTTQDHVIFKQIVSTYYITSSVHLIHNLLLHMNMIIWRVVSKSSAITRWHFPSCVSAVPWYEGIYPWYEDPMAFWYYKKQLLDVCVCGYCTTIYCIALHHMYSSGKLIFWLKMLDTACMWLR